MLIILFNNFIDMLQKLIYFNHYHHYLWHRKLTLQLLLFFSGRVKYREEDKRQAQLKTLNVYIFRGLDLCYIPFVHGHSPYATYVSINDRVI